MAMSEELGPEGLKEPGFPVSRRGYSRRAVDRLLAAAAARWSELEAEHSALREEVEKLGGLKNLKEEFDRVSDEVREILQAARQAADDLRSRTAEELQRRLGEAEEQAHRLVGEAQADAQELRRQAWTTGSRLLEQVREEVQRLLESAEQNILLIRADAEREARRLTTSARHEGGEIARSARMEAERLLVDARAEAAEIIENARGDVRSVRERARSLEAQRDDLKDELEIARSALEKLEAEVEELRRARDMAPGVRVIPGLAEEGAELAARIVHPTGPSDRPTARSEPPSPVEPAPKPPESGTDKPARKRVPEVRLTLESPERRGRFFK
ncbi:MAG: DivIVA domain-containing protein [Acidimicrobiia bacterium]